MRRGLLGTVVLVALLVPATRAHGEPQLHGAVTAGTGFRAVAPFDETGSAPFFMQVEAGFLLDPIQKFSHGFSLSVPFSPGESTFAIMPSYLLFRRPNLAYAYFARVGYQLVIAPPTSDDRSADLANGIEVGAGFIWYVRAGLGLVVEADLDYAAGVDDSLIVGGHGGVAIGYELLP